MSKSQHLVWPVHPCLRRNSQHSKHLLRRQRRGKLTSGPHAWHPTTLPHTLLAHLPPAHLPPGTYTLTTPFTTLPPPFWPCPAFFGRWAGDHRPGAASARSPWPPTSMAAPPDAARLLRKSSVDGGRSCSQGDRDSMRWIELA